MATQQNIDNSLEADEVSVFTYAEETVVGEDGVKKKKKFRKLRKSLSKKRKSLRNLLGGSKRKLDVSDDDVGAKGGSSVNINFLNDEQAMREKKMIGTTTDSASSDTSLDRNKGATTNGEDADEDLDISSGVTNAQQLVTVPEITGGSKPSVASGVKTSQIFLLIMDPASRCFEVLQLDLDMEQAIVSDLLHQIPESATDSVLQNVVYCGVCRPYSDTSLDASSSLQASGIQNDDVLIAIPKEMDLNRVHALAEPILTDPDVASVLKLPPPPPAIKGVKEKSVSFSDDIKAPQHSRSGSFLRTITLLVTLVMLMTSVLVDVQRKITSPLGPGDSLEVGEWRSKCGLWGIIPIEEFMGCKPMTLEFQSNGSLSLHDSSSEHRSLLWEIKVDENEDKDEDEDIDFHFIISEAGKILINGEEPHFVSITDDGKSSLQPWPFTDAVNISRKGVEKRKSRRKRH
mmetsp:Transcript_26104/g.38902  ORF Transcript_26104/g.38902 Transcript_26104/m.38902 type:complete len:459 (-) Transcript_26104:518-1894(-)|eukprot:CAMPEP_0116026294 /NCGR_PEP_ID=MMETSP0321-20121206/13730_1 /TAXON_ID=163516 /ORGANISM="Leptocylindrus danicus var. danicus, Strain B650" /LENGTH=458 /DNA_ID=CAMNT_0003498995 /DNA_START=161 /DNA_END=1537 /DNA_ORIENTATION=+